MGDCGEAALGFLQRVKQFSERRKVCWHSDEKKYEKKKSGESEGWDSKQRICNVKRMKEKAKEVGRASKVVFRGGASKRCVERGEGEGREIDLAKEDGRWGDGEVPYIKYENV